MANSFDITKTTNLPDMPKEMFGEIADEYRTMIVVPPIKPDQQFLLCPVGLIGAGKTTIVEPLAERLGLVRISTDEIRKLMKQHGYNYSGVKDISYATTKLFLDQGYSVAIDGNCGTDDTQRQIAEAVKKYNLEAIWIHINPPEEFIINKLKNYNHTWLFESGDEAVRSYREYKKTHDYSNSDIPFIYTFDPSRSDVPKQLDEAEKLIKEKLTS